MNKIVASFTALGLLSSVVSAEVMIGVDYTAMSSMKKTVSYDQSSATREADFSYTPITFKVGLGTPGEDYVYLYYQKSEPEFDLGGKDIELSEIGYEYIGQFDMSHSVKPFWEFGTTFGWQNLPKGYYSTDTQFSVSANIGAGLSYYLIPQVELLASANYQFRFYQPIKTYSDTQYERDNGVNVAVGINFWPFAEEKKSVASSEDKSNSQDSEEEEEGEEIY